MEHKLALCMKGSRQRTRLTSTQPRSTTPPRSGPIRPLPCRQLVLFDAERQLVRDGRYVELPQPPLSDLAEALKAATFDYGKRHGWPNNLIGTTRRGLRVVLALQDTPGGVDTARVDQ